MTQSSCNIVSFQSQTSCSFVIYSFLTGNKHMILVLLFNIHVPQFSQNSRWLSNVIYRVGKSANNKNSVNLNYYYSQIIIFQNIISLQGIVTKVKQPSLNLRFLYKKCDKHVFVSPTPTPTQPARLGRKWSLDQHQCAQDSIQSS